MCRSKGSFSGSMNRKWISIFEGQKEGHHAKHGANTVLRFALVTKTQMNLSGLQNCT